MVFSAARAPAARSRRVVCRRRTQCYRAFGSIEMEVEMVAVEAGREMGGMFLPGCRLLLRKALAQADPAAHRVGRLPGRSLPRTAGQSAFRASDIPRFPKAHER